MSGRTPRSPCEKKSLSRSWLTDSQSPLQKEHHVRKTREEKSSKTPVYVSEPSLGENPNVIDGTVVRIENETTAAGCPVPGASGAASNNNLMVEFHAEKPKPPDKRSFAVTETLRLRKQIPTWTSDEESLPSFLY